jgi:hypothetical protein
MGNTITPKEALALLDKEGELLTIRFVTCDKQRNKAGKLVTVTGAKVVGKNWNNHIRTVTCNEYNHPVDIHYPLITRVNNKKISY